MEPPKDHRNPKEGIPLSEEQAELQSLVHEEPWTVTLYRRGTHQAPIIQERWWLTDAETANAVYTTFKVYIRGGATHEVYSARQRTATVFRISTGAPIIAMTRGKPGAVHQARGAEGVEGVQGVKA